MKKYTVLLLYPDYLSDTAETYFAHVEAEDSGAAQYLAASQAADDNEMDRPDDFLVLAVFAGWQEDIKYE